MVCKYAIHKPWGWKSYEKVFCGFATEYSPINFVLIVYKHGTQEEEFMFSEIPGWAVQYPLPSEVGYMAVSSRA